MTSCLVAVYPGFTRAQSGEIRWENRWDNKSKDTVGLLLSERLGGGVVDCEKHQCRLDVICSDKEKLPDVPAL